MCPRSRAGEATGRLAVQQISNGSPPYTQKKMKKISKSFLPNVPKMVNFFFKIFKKIQKKIQKIRKKNEFFFDFFENFNFRAHLDRVAQGYPNSFPETDLHSNCKTKRRKFGHWRNAGSGVVGWLPTRSETVSQGKTGFAGINPTIHRGSGFVVTE